MTELPIDVDACISLLRKQGYAYLNSGDELVDAINNYGRDYPLSLDIFLLCSQGKSSKEVGVLKNMTAGGATYHFKKAARAIFYRHNNRHIQLEQFWGAGLSSKCVRILDRAGVRNSSDCQFLLGNELEVTSTRRIRNPFQGRLANHSKHDIATIAPDAVNELRMLHGSPPVCVYSQTELDAAYSAAVSEGAIPPGQSAEVRLRWHAVILRMFIAVDATRRT